MTRDFYGGKDPRDIPAYTLTDAARYLGLARSTLAQWVSGRFYETQDGKRHSVSLIQGTRVGRNVLLSFNNLVEAHVLASIRKDISMIKLKKSLNWISRKLHVRRPLLDNKFQTDGVVLFVEHLGELIDVSDLHGQQQIRAAIEMYLRRIERDPEGVPIRLYPWVNMGDDMPIAIDPRRNFGRPTVNGAGVPTAPIYDQFKGGDSIPFLAKDFRLSQQQIEAAIAFEQHRARTAA